MGELYVVLEKAGPGGRGIPSSNARRAAAKRTPKVAAPAVSGPAPSGHVIPSKLFKQPAVKPAAEPAEPAEVKAPAEPAEPKEPAVPKVTTPAAPQRSWRIAGVRHDVSTGVITHLHQEFHGDKPTGNFAAKSYQSNGRHVANYKTRMFSAKTGAGAKEKFHSIHQEHAGSQTAAHLAGGGDAAVGGPVSSVAQYRHIAHPKALSTLHQAHKIAGQARQAEEARGAAKRTAVGNAVARAEAETPRRFAANPALPNSSTPTLGGKVKLPGATVKMKTQPEKPAGLIYGAHHPGTHEAVQVHTLGDGSHVVRHTQTAPTGHTIVHSAVHFDSSNRAEALAHAAGITSHGLNGKLARGIAAGKRSYRGLKSLQRRGRIHGFERLGMPPKPGEPMEKALAILWDDATLLEKAKQWSHPDQIGLGFDAPVVPKVKVSTPKVGMKAPKVGQAHPSLNFGGAGGVQDPEFEGKHPRASGGKFASKPGSGGESEAKPDDVSPTRWARAKQEAAEAVDEWIAGDHQTNSQKERQLQAIREVAEKHGVPYDALRKQTLWEPERGKWNDDEETSGLGDGLKFSPGKNPKHMLREYGKPKPGGGRLLPAAQAKADYERGEREKAKAAVAKQKVKVAAAEKPEPDEGNDEAERVEAAKAAWTVHDPVGEYHVKDSSGKFVPVKDAERIHIPNRGEFDMFAHPSVDGSGWSVSEGMTGTTWAKGETREEAVKKIKEIVGTIDPHILSRTIQSVMVKDGISPRYTSGDYDSDEYPEGRPEPDESKPAAEPEKPAGVHPEELRGDFVLSAKSDRIKAAAALRYLEKNPGRTGVPWLRSEFGPEIVSHLKRHGFIVESPTGEAFVEPGALKAISPGIAPVPAEHERPADELFSGKGKAALEHVAEEAYKQSAHEWRSNGPHNHRDWREVGWQARAPEDPGTVERSVLFRAKDRDQPITHRDAVQQVEELARRMAKNDSLRRFENETGGPPAMTAKEAAGLAAEAMDRHNQSYHAKLEAEAAEKQAKKERAEKNARDAEAALKVKTPAGQYHIHHGNGEFVPVEGQKVEIPGFEHHDLFAHKTGKSWTVSEGRTGMSIAAGGTTKANAVELAAATLRAGRDRINDTIHRAMASNGVSPRYLAGEETAEGLAAKKAAAKAEAARAKAEKDAARPLVDPEAPQIGSEQQDFHYGVPDSHTKAWRYEAGRGRPVTFHGFEGYKFFVRKADNGDYQVHESRSGSVIGDASSTQKGAVLEAKKRLDGVGPEKLGQAIDRHVEAKGASPSHREDPIHKAFSGVMVEIEDDLNLGSNS